MKSRHWKRVWGGVFGGLIPITIGMTLVIMRQGTREGESVPFVLWIMLIVPGLLLLGLAVWGISWLFIRLNYWLERFSIQTIRQEIIRRGGTPLNVEWRQVETGPFEGVFMGIVFRATYLLDDVPREAWVLIAGPRFVERQWHWCWDYDEATDSTTLPG